MNMQITLKTKITVILDSQVSPPKAGNKQKPKFKKNI